MPVAFSDWAAFSGIDGIGQLKIDDTYHKAFVSVDEAGTEAAAATAVVIVPPALPLEVRLDRPFLFMIRDIETGAILFLGRVVNPVAQGSLTSEQLNRSRLRFAYARTLSW